MKAMQHRGQSATQPAGGGGQVVAMPRAVQAVEHETAQYAREGRAS